jgi:hypothetical protein
MQKQDTIFFSILSIFVTMAIVQSINIYQTAQATGGAGEIKGLIDPIIERAITALQNNNTELALEEIQTLKNELEDTFKADEDEEED